MKQVRKIYDKAFKEKAVQLSYDRTNILEFARELGITAPQLYKWRKEFEEFGEGKYSSNKVEILHLDNIAIDEATGDKKKFRLIGLNLNLYNFIICCFFITVLLKIVDKVLV